MTTASTRSDTPLATPDPLAESELLARLAELPSPALPAGTGDHVKRRARAAFLRAHERARHPWWDRLTRIYGRVEPVMAVAVASMYLLWAFQSAIALHVGG